MWSVLCLLTAALCLQKTPRLAVSVVAHCPGLDVVGCLVSKGSFLLSLHLCQGILVLDVVDVWFSGLVWPSSVGYAALHPLMWVLCCSETF